MKTIPVDFKAQFSQALGALAIALGEELSKEKILVYYEVLKGHGAGNVLFAIDKALSTCKFFPKPAELIELITGGKAGGQDPAVAWQVVLDTLKRVGGYANVTFEDGAIAAAIEALGGWSDLALITYEDLTLQKIPDRFAKLYAEAVRQGRHRRPGEVIGHSARSNAHRGYDHDSPSLPARTMAQIMADAQPGLEPVPPPALPFPKREELSDGGQLVLDEINVNLGRLARKRAL